MKIHIFGASCSGVTTLGEELSEIYKIPYFDSDDFFWGKTDPPFTIRRNPIERNTLLSEKIASQADWIFGGSIINWSLDINFDLVIFLLIPKDIRLNRLKNREIEKYGDVIFTSKDRNDQFNEFLSWSAGYDDNTARGRTLNAHKDWMKSLKCPLLEIIGDLSVEDRIKRVVQCLIELNSNVNAPPNS